MISIKAKKCNGNFVCLVLSDGHYVHLNWPLLLIYYLIRISRDRFYGSYNSHYRSQVAQDIMHDLIIKMPIIVNLELIFLESISAVFPVKLYFTDTFLK